ncbi:MAG: RNA polymerase sigma-70 factor [Tannerella sp.]|jgi:RNA polymerase sigma-70 factor (ECF subfamily)|nr:RNA polymerase sigma-70 factor [Tannerella sp.]
MQSPVDIVKIRQGDPDAFRDFFTLFYPKLMALARRFVDEQTAGDLVQDVFLAFWEQKQTIEAENIQSLLYKWLQNRCLNHLKHQMVVDEYATHVRLAEERNAFLDRMTDENDVFNQLSNKDILEKIETSVKKLPSKRAQAFRLCYFHDMSHKEIAEVLNISPRTVEEHIRQAILFLRKDLRYLLTCLCLFLFRLGTFFFS